MDWGIFATVIGTGIGQAIFLYKIIKNFKNDINLKVKEPEKRFEMIDQRMFLLCMGKSLPDILKAEREEFYKEEHK